MRATVEPFQSAAARADQSIRQTLRQLTAGNAAQQARLDTIDRLVEAKFSELQKTMALRRQSGMEAALAVVRTGEGKRIMDECRALLSAMEEEDRLLLAQRHASGRRSGTCECAGSWGWAAAACCCCWSSRER